MCKVDPIHVYPLHDLAEHVLDGPYCPCQPRVGYCDGLPIIIHNAWDKREKREALEYQTSISGKAIQ